MTYSCNINTNFYLSQWFLHNYDISYLFPKRTKETISPLDIQVTFSNFTSHLDIFTVKSNTVHGKMLFNNMINISTVTKENMVKAGTELFEAFLSDLDEWGKCCLLFHVTGARCHITLTAGEVVTSNGPVSQSKTSQAFQLKSLTVSAGPRSLSPDTRLICQTTMKHYLVNSFVQREANEKQINK